MEPNKLEEVFETGYSFTKHIILLVVSSLEYVRNWASSDIVNLLIYTKPFTSGIRDGVFVSSTRDISLSSLEYVLSWAKRRHCKLST